MAKSTKKEAKFLTALIKGRSISRKQAMAQFKLGNPSATVLRIQDAGYQLQRTYSLKKVRGTKLKVRTVTYSLA